MNSEQQLENRLRRLAPGETRLNRDTLMFQAGRQAGRRQARSWQGISGALALALVALGWQSFAPPPRAPVPEVVQVEPPAPEPASTPPPPLVAVVARPQPLTLPAHDYLRLRHRLLIEGIEALPPVAVHWTGTEEVPSAGGWYRLEGTAGPRPGFFPVLKPRTHGDRS